MFRVCLRDPLQTPYRSWKKLPAVLLTLKKHRRDYLNEYILYLGKLGAMPTKLQVRGQCNFQSGGSMKQIKPLIVNARWDDEAKVWVATSSDISGLVTEADSMDALVKKLQVIIPELLDANGYPDGGDNKVLFQLNSELTAVAYRQAA